MNSKNTFQIVLAVCLLLAGCSPYTSQINQLDKAYAAGQIDAKTYFYERQQLMQGDMQWRQQVAANAAAMNAGAARAAYLPPPVYVVAPQVQPVQYGNLPGYYNFPPVR